MIIKGKIKFCLVRLPAILSVLLLLYYLVIILRDFINFLVSNYSSIDVLLYEGFPILAPVAMAVLVFSFALLSKPKEIRVSFLSKEEFGNLSYACSGVCNDGYQHKIFPHYTGAISQVEGSSSFYIAEGENILLRYSMRKDFSNVEVTWNKPLTASRLVGRVKENFPRTIRYLEGNTLLYTLTIGEDFRIKRITDNRTNEVLFLEGGCDDKEIQADEGVV